MIVQLFRTNRPTVLFSLLLYTFILRGAFLAMPEWALAKSNSFMEPYILGWGHYNQIPQWVFQLLDVLLIYAQAIFLNFILNANNIFEKQTYVPAFIFVTLSGIFGEWIAADVFTVAQLFMLISLYNLFTLSGQELSKDNIFYTAMYLGVGALFYFPSSVFLIVILGTLILRAYSLSDILLALLGFALPYYFLGLGFYLQDRLPEYFHMLEGIYTLQPALSLDVSLLQIIMLCIILLLAIIGYVGIASSTDFRVVKLRRLIFISLGYLVVTALATPFVTDSKLMYIQLLIVPASIFIAKIFDRERLRFYHHIITYILILGLAFFELYHLKVI